MIPKNWRIKFFNYLGAGKLTLTHEEKPMTYSIVGPNTGPYSLGGVIGGGVTLNPGHNMTSTSQTITIKVTPANGGNIVAVQTEPHSNETLYIIADDTDFDRELGKIITMSKLKA